MFIKQIKLSKQEKDRLIRLKAKTGITNWNTLCRWALCLSLADISIPYAPDIPSDSNVEMSWQTFAGDYQAVYEAIFRKRCYDDGIDMDDLSIAKYFRLHLNRGINEMASRLGPKSIDALLQYAIKETSNVNLP